MTAISFKDEDRKILEGIRTDIAKVDAQANLDQSVMGDDERLIQARQELETMKSTYSADPSKKAEIERMIGDVENLLGLAGNEEVRNTDATNASWGIEMKELNAMIDSYIDHGDGSAFVDTPHGTEVDKSELPSGSPASQATGTLYDVNTTPKTYVEADDAAKKYNIYDADGENVTSFNYDDAAKYGIDMGDSQVLALSKDGFNSSWLINGDGGRTKIIPGQAFSADGVDATDDAAGADDTKSVPIPEGSIAGANNGPGPGTAYKNMTGDVDNLPGNLAAKQKDQQVNFLSDAKPPIYITSDNKSPINYSIYDKEGLPIDGGLQPPFSVDLGNGSHFVASVKGVGNAWTTTDLSSLPKETVHYAFDENNALVKTEAKDADGAEAASENPAQKNTLKTPQVVTNSPDLPGALKNNNNPVAVLGTTPPTYMLYDGKAYTMYDSAGEPAKESLSEDKSKKPFALGLGNGTWLIATGTGFANQPVIDDVTKSPLYQKEDLNIWTAGPDINSTWSEWKRPAK